MRILFLTQLFQPEGFFKGLPFVKALMKKGHDVEVLTGFPHHPAGKVYPGYRIRPYQCEVMAGVKIHRVPIYPSHDKSAVRRIISYISFSTSVFLMGPWLIKKPDVIYVYNLVTLGLPALFFRFLFGSKVIIDVQDLWPESVASSGMLRHKVMLSILNGICNWVYRKADQLVVLSPGFKNCLAARGIDPEKIVVIYNWCDELSLTNNDSSQDKEKELDLSEKLVVLFAGTMGLGQGLDTVLDCAMLCRKTLPNIQFVMIGGGVDRIRLQQKSKEMGLNNVTFLPPRPIEEMGPIFAMADALLVHLKDDPLFRITIPSKTQAYLYEGKPIIMGVLGNAADLVSDAGAGILCEPENPVDMLEAIRTLINETTEEERHIMGNKGKEYYINNLSFDAGVEKFERVFLQALH